MLLGLASLPFGAADITDDIASSFGVRRSQAERMKCFYGSAMQSPRDHREMIEIAPMSSDGQSVEGGRITRAQRSEEHTSELQSIMRISYAVLCLTKTKSRETRPTAQTNYPHTYHHEI